MIEINTKHNLYNAMRCDAAMLIVLAVRLNIATRDGY